MVTYRRTEITKMNRLAMRNFFEVKSTDLGGRIGRLRTKTSIFETPALLPVIHPTKQLLPCREIYSMGFGAVMTNAYTTSRLLRERASEGIHRLIDFPGSVMTDSGGYQLLEFGSVDMLPEEMAAFEESIGTDIAIVLDKPTGLEVTKRFATRTVTETLRAAELTKERITRRDILWTLPLQGGRYLDLVSRSAAMSANLGYDLYALGSPVEVMQQYDFSLLVRMILACKRKIPQQVPFHVFGAGHPLILPLAAALGCDLFDSASYMLYAQKDRYISKSGTIKLESIKYLPCSCTVCKATSATDLKSMNKADRVILLAKHNLLVLKQVIDETKQAIWEGRLWEYIHANSRNHPRAYEAFRLASREASKEFELGTPSFKERGILIFDNTDLLRPESRRARARISNLDLSKKTKLVILPETRKKPFITSELYKETVKLVSIEDTLIAFLCPNFGAVPAEVSDIFPYSQFTSSLSELPENDPILRRRGGWAKVLLLMHVGAKKIETENWVKFELRKGNDTAAYRSGRPRCPGGATRIGPKIQVLRSYRSFKRFLRRRSQV